MNSTYLSYYTASLPISLHFITDHISLHAALGSLNHLVELHITFQLRNVGINYRRDQFQFTTNDAKNLSRGLDKCCHLNVLRSVHHL